jgi:type II secretory pathway component PulF
MNLFLHVSLQEKILFTKNLALALRSGVSLVNSLKLVAAQARTRSFKKILASLLEDANRGVFLSDSLAKFRGVFGELFINIIRVAETSGTLPENLIYLGDELSKRSALRKKVKGALIYPIIILIATIVIAVAMLVFVFPKITPLFLNAKVELPLTTRILIGLSDAVSKYGIFIGIGIGVLIAGIRSLLIIQPVRFIYHEMLFYVPLFKNAIINYNMANFTRTLGLLLKSGVRITEAIDITASTLTNLVYSRELKQAADHVRKGEFLSRYLAARSRFFPIMMVNMLEVGENTGNLTENLTYLAEYYENEVDDFTKNLSSILEPILLLVMGGVVAFIALSFITPIYQLTRAIK